MRVLDVLRYTLGITFLYPENCIIRQPLSPLEMPDKTVFAVPIKDHILPFIRLVWYLNF